MTLFSVRMSDSEQASLLIKLISSMDTVEEITIDDGEGIDYAESIEFNIDPRRPQMLTEEAAFRAMLPDLLQNHMGEYVAVYQQKLVDYDQDMVTLVDRVHAKYPNQIILVREVTAESDRPIFIRSPRLVR